MTKAIDMRVRPPYKKMREATILRHVATEGHRRDIEKINHQIPVSFSSASRGMVGHFCTYYKQHSTK